VPEQVGLDGREQSAGGTGAEGREVPAGASVIF